MKAVIFGLAALGFMASSGLSQQQQPPPQQPSLSIQTQPSEMDKARAAVWRPKLKTQITYSGPVVDLVRSEKPLETLPGGTNVVRVPHDDLSVDLITRRPRGIVLFAINF